MKVFKVWNHAKDLNKIKAGILNNSVNLKSLERRFNPKEFDELKSVAKAQLKARNIFDKGYKLMANLSDLRFSTPQIIGNYRAERILNQLGKIKIVDLFSGVGFQTISFAKFLKRVLSVEIDERKFFYSKKNVETFGLRNVSLVLGNVFSDEIFNKIKEFRPKVIFADPQRKEFGYRKDEENLIFKIYNKFSSLTKNIIIEAPPFISVDSLRRKLPDFEAEFLSVNSNLRRLTLYFGDLIKHSVSSIALPSRSYVGLDTCSSKLPETDKTLDYLYEVDEALTVSKLFNCLFKEALLLNLGRKAILTSDKLIEVYPNFLQKYKVLFSKKYSADEDREILEFLYKNKFKYVVLKQGFSPETYWRIRNWYESNLKMGENKIAYLFKLNDEVILAELQP